MADLINYSTWSQDLGKGYPLSILVSSLDSKFVCLVCKCLLRYPVQTGCGERLCRSCSESILNKEDPRCPVCSEQLNRKTIFRDMFAERETLSLEAKCENAEIGCKWIGPLKDWEDHMYRCEFQQMRCSNGCGKVVTKAMFERHAAEECTHRRQKCQFCSANVAFATMDTHLQQCAMYPIPCSLCQSATIPRDQMEYHKREVCPGYTIKCPFADYGCSGEFIRREQQRHDEQYTHHHMSLLLQGLRKKDQHIKSLEKVIDDLATQFTQLKNSTAVATAPIAQTPTPPAGAAAVSGKRHEEGYQMSAGPRQAHSMPGESGPPRQGLSAAETGESRQLLTRTASKVSELNLAVEKLNMETTTISRTQAVQDVQMADLSLRVDIVDVKSTSGVLVWKIGDITRRRREALSGRTPSLYSAPFYTSPAGYKMCARIYLDGDGMGKGACVSVFFVMMRGEYDALLSWPFQLRVTMILMDQSEPGVLRRNITEVFKPDKRSASFKRPVTEMNTGSGCPMFAPVSVLESPTYVKDDTIFIKVVVDKATSQFTPPDSERL